MAGACGEPGEPDAGRLGFPAGLDVADDGSLWIADRDNDVVVRACP